MYELFGFELTDFKEIFYLFCLAVLVYRYLTVGRKYPLFGPRQKKINRCKPCDTEETSHQYSNLRDYSDFDIKDVRSLEYSYFEREQNQKH